MDKKAFSALPRPTLTKRQEGFPLLMSNMAYLVTAQRLELGGQDTLVMNFFQCKDQGLLPEFRTFCQAQDYISQDLTTEKTKWRKGAINHLAGYKYWGNADANIVINSMKERRMILGFLTEFKRRNRVRDYVGWRHPGAQDNREIKDRIDEYQETIKEWRLERRHQAEKERIDARMEKFGALPDDYDEFVEGTVFKEDNYIFYSLSGKTAYCSRCRQDLAIDGGKKLRRKDAQAPEAQETVKHNGTVTCPCCGTRLFCKSIGRGRRNLTAVRWSAFASKDGEDVLVRYFAHEKYFGDDFRNPRITSWEHFRRIHTAQRTEEYEWGRFKNTEEMRWCVEKNWFYGLFPPSEYRIPRNMTLYHQDWEDITAGTCMKYSAVGLYLQYMSDAGKAESRPWLVDGYFASYRKNPALEQLVKVGFCEMARESIEESYRVPEWTNGRTVLETLGISKSQFRMLRRIKDPTFHDVGILKYKKDLSWEDFLILRELKSDRLIYRKFADFMRYATLHRLIRYLKDQGIEHPQDYFDYAGWTEKMGYDMRNEFNLFPKNFRKAHDERSDEYLKFKDKEEKAERRRFNRKLKKMRLAASDVDAMNLRVAGLFVRLPNQLEELKVEGEALHHCVGTYMEQVRKGKTMIFFIRREAEPDKPYYTMEWKGKVVQCRGFRNRDMTEDVRAFVNIFEQKMLMDGSLEEKFGKVG